MCGDAESLIASWTDDATTESEALSRVRGYLSVARCRIVRDSTIRLMAWLNKPVHIPTKDDADHVAERDSGKSEPPKRGDAASATSPPERSSELHTIVQKAFFHLDAADRLLADVESKNKDADTSELRRRSELLRVFGRAFIALNESTDSDESRQSLIDVCGELAPYVDDDNKQISESAKLWQVVAYRRAGKPDRALQVARPVLSPPASPMIGLFIRFERCRALAEKGDYVAAISLAARIAVRAESWFEGEDESKRIAVLDRVKTLQADLYREWSDRLRDEGKAELAAAAAEESRKLEPQGRSMTTLVLDESITGIPELTDASSKPAENDEEESDEP
ncbi:MAG: hypothetical protein HZA51_17470 [Planctomycetes bacterium]|nr:hypothetical protein [Planctomycetota bacterium]